VVTPVNPAISPSLAGDGQTSAVMDSDFAVRGPRQRFLTLTRLMGQCAARGANGLSRTARSAGRVGR